MKQWVCRTCRYMHTGDAAPESCPVCSASTFDEMDEGATEPELRRPLSLLLPPEDARWRCQVCGAEHTGSSPPAICPICGVGPEMWEQMPHRTRIDTDPTSLGGEVTCTVCGSPMGVSLGQRCQVCGGRQAWLSPLPNMAEPAHPPRSSRTPRSYVVLGSGIAGLRAAESIRANDAGARVVMLSRERCLPYNRFNITRFLDGNTDAASLMIHPPSWYTDQGIDIKLETDVVSVQPREHVIRTRGREVRYDRLVIALGARVSVPPLPNVWVHGVQPLRSLRDCTRVLEVSSPGRRVVIVGGGVLGVEAATALRRRGCEVTLCESGSHVMQRQLDVAAARLLQSHLEGLGVRFVFGRQLESIEGDECVRGVRLTGDAFEPADLVLLATGIAPNITIARSAGLTTRQGIVVDDTLQTSDPDIYAAGDVAEHRGSLFGLWPTAMEMGSVAGANAVGGAETFKPTVQPVFLKVVNVDLCSVGKITAVGPTERELVHTENGGATYQKVVFDEGRVVGAILMGDTQALSSVHRAIEHGRDLSSLIAASASVKELLAALD